MADPVVKMLCHKGPVTAIALDAGGKYMVTTGLDSHMKVWDIRKFTPLHTYSTMRPATSLSISQKGLLAVGHGPHVTIWNDAFKFKQQSPYMNHLQPSTTVQSVKFCPYDDVLGVGHTDGISSLLIPGAGEANFDALEANPFANTKQRQEAEVKALLDKIQPEMITLNPHDVARVNFRSGIPDETVDPVKALAASELKKKTRGRNSAAKRLLRKQVNVIDAKKEALRARLEKEAQARKAAETGESDKKKSFSYALDRFDKKRRNQ
eukprot:Partr_v1_DN28323_c1_g1_i3_m79219 putative WD repeat domain 46